VALAFECSVLVRVAAVFMLAGDVSSSMNEAASRTTPRFRLGVTVVGLAGLLTVVALTGTAGALVSIDEAFYGFALTVAVAAFAWRYPDELVSTPRTEAVALAVVWAAGGVFGLYAPDALAVMVWTLVATLLGLVSLVVGRPRTLARLVARVEHAESDR
jgi:hypothetical protein